MLAPLAVAVIALMVPAATASGVLRCSAPMSRRARATQAMTVGEIAFRIGRGRGRDDQDLDRRQWAKR